MSIMENFAKTSMKIAYKLPALVIRRQEKTVRKKYYKKYSSNINSINWSQKEIEEISKYWRRYGIKKLDRKGFKYYQSVNGVFEPRYITSMFFDTVVERRLNPYYCSEVFQKKELASYLFSNIDGLYLPKTFLKVTHNHEYVCDDIFISREEAINKCFNLGKIICKPTIGTARGVGIKTVTIKDGIDVVSGKSISEILDEYGNRDVLFQEWVYPSEELKTLYPRSLGTFRVTTYLLNGEVYCGPIALRQSVGDVEIDGVNCKGYTIGVDKETGRLYKTGYFYDEKNQYKMFEHPDTKVKFENYYIGDINKMISVAKKLHSRISDIGIASWDLSFAANGDVVFIEVNLMYEGVDINQIANGKPLFEENSDEMIKYIFSIR